jgi:hypothetical protein
MASIFANRTCIEEWLEASSKTIVADPRDKRAVDVHTALSDAHELYFPETKTKDSTELPTEKRAEIFTRFERSALTGYPTAMFFEGVARREGFGCKQDQTTGNALIQVAAVARGCVLALNYLGVSYFSNAPEMAVRFFQQAALKGYNRAYRNLGIANLYGVGVKQSYAGAIRFFTAAGPVARPELQKVAAHLKNLQARAAIQPVNVSEANVVHLDHAARSAPRPQRAM